MAQWIPIEDRPEHEQREFADAMRTMAQHTDVTMSTAQMERMMAARSAAKGVLEGFAAQQIGLDELAASTEPDLRKMAIDNGWEDPDGPARGLDDYRRAAGVPTKAEYAFEQLRFDADAPADEVTADSERLQLHFDSLDVDGKLDMLDKLSNVYSAVAAHTGRVTEEGERIAEMLNDAFDRTGNSAYLDAAIARQDRDMDREAKLNRLGGFIADKVDEVVDELDGLSM